MAQLGIGVDFLHEFAGLHLCRVSCDASTERSWEMRLR